MRKVLIFSADSKSLYFFRAHFIDNLLLKGLEVVCYCQEDSFFQEAKSLFLKKNVQIKSLDFRNSKKNVFHDLKIFYTIYQILKKENPSYLFSYHIKPVLYTSLVCYWFSNIKYFPTITGLGYLFTSNNIISNLLKNIILFLLRFSFKKTTSIFFQNKDDLNFFVEKKVNEKEKSILVNGSGINLIEYAFHELPKEMSFLFIGRINKDKGINEYIEACKNIKIKYPFISCKIIGSSSSNPTSVSINFLQSICESYGIEYIGEVKDVKEWLINNTVFVLPSYREGVPRSGIEALAIGRPIITTEAIGCREIVNGLNGYLVSPKDPIELEKAMIKISQISFPDLKKMSKESRLLAEKKFNVEDITQIMIKSMKLGQN